MNKNIQTIIGILVVITIAGLVGFYIYNDISSKKENVDISQENKVNNELPAGISIEGDGDYSVEIISVDDESVNISVPSLDRDIVFGTDFPLEAQDIMRNKIEKLSSELKEDNSLLENWIELGIQRKTIGDYVGAREAWEYAIALRPSGSVAYHNLGDLHAYFLKNNIKAEENFLKAIENAPNDVYLYFKISEFYKNILNDMDKARTIVQQGIKANPSSEELKSLLASLE